MQIMKSKAAILAESRKPLVLDEITLPDALEAGQVLVKVLFTSICGAQINEIEAVKGPDKFLPHLLGHEASARDIAFRGKEIDAAILGSAQYTAYAADPALSKNLLEVAEA